MSTPRKKKSSRKDPQQTNQYSYILGNQLHLVRRPDPAAQDDQLSETEQKDFRAGGRRSTDRDTFDLYHCWESLSPREKDVTILVCKGLTDAQIASRLYLSISTVKSYLQHIFLKADVSNRRELLIKFVNFNFPQDTPYR